MIVIDREKCIGCGLCVKDCPTGKIKIEEKKAVYAPECIQCGHCVAVCPRKAVSIPEYDMDDIETFDENTFTVNPEQFLRAVKFRRSIRNYKEQPLEREKMERILQAGRYTPTAKNRQECRFIVLQNELGEFKEKLWETVPELKLAENHMFSRGSKDSEKRIAPLCNAFQIHVQKMEERPI